MMSYYLIPSSGYLRIGGEDRAAFLQRQTTNDLRLVQPGRAVLTVHTTPTARILDVLYVLPEADALGVITLPGRGESTRRYLQSRIFFMDKVTVAHASVELAQVDVMGPESPMVLSHGRALGFFDHRLQPLQSLVFFQRVIPSLLCSAFIAVFVFISASRKHQHQTSTPLS